MRQKLWTTTGLSLVVLFAVGRTTSAQMPYGYEPASSTAFAQPPQGGLPNLPPAAAGLAPQQAGPYEQVTNFYSQPFTGNPASHHVPAIDPSGQAALPPGFLPWPQISPYEPQFSQHLNQDGLWFHDFNSRGPRYSFGVEFLWAKLRGPDHGVVGDGDAQSYRQYLLGKADLFDDDALEFDTIQEIVLRFSDGNVTPETRNGNPAFNWFDSVDAAKALNDVDAPGIRVQWAVIDPDDSGFIATAWYAGEGVRYDANDFATRPSGDIDLLAQVFDDLVSPLEDADKIALAESTFANLNGLPLNDGSANGLTVPYDLEFRLDFESEAAEITGEFLLTPWFKRKSVMVRPMWGVRYLFLHEEFGFFGRDSNVLYNSSDNLIPELKEHSLPNGVDDDADTVIDNAIVSEEAGDGDGIFLFPGAITDPFTAFLDSDTRSHMVGPEIGVRYDLGGRKFRFFGQSKFALLANFERTQINGDNIGYALRSPIGPDGFTLDPDGDDIIDSISIGDLIEPTPENPNPNRFEDAERHAHVSPLFEQSFFVEAQLFQHIPLLNKLHMLESAKVRGGFTYIAVFEVAKPVESIDWTANPQGGLFPTVETKRDKWTTHNWSLAVFWDY